MGDDYKDYLEYIKERKTYYYYNVLEHKESEPDYDAQLDKIPLSKIESYLRRKKLKNIESI
jgi:hypothetical protein